MGLTATLFEILIMAVLLFLFSMTVLNFLSALRLKNTQAKRKSQLPSVSVLVPARNEAHNLTRLIPSLVSSDYPEFEILILDDESSDQTYETAQKLLGHSQVKFQVIKGQTWNQNRSVSGKNFACHQLSQVAQGEILIFCDADVLISKTALSDTIQLMLQNPKASGVSGLLYLKAPSLLQHFVLPWILQIPLMMTLPLRWAWRAPIKSMQMANGQWLAIWHEKYKKIGGHLALGTSVVEDVEIAQRLTENSSGGMIPVITSKEISVSMYTDWKSMVQGFSKNLISIYGGHPAVFILILASLNLIFFSPFFISNNLLKAISISLIFGLHFLSSLAFGNSALSSLSSGIMTWPTLVILNGFASLIVKNYFKKQTQWKGRSITFPEDST